MTFRIQLVRSREALGALVPAWEELAAHACEPNPFYEPWILLAALRAQGDEGLRCVCVWDGERLVGLFPFHHVRKFKGLPVATLTSWRHSAYLLCTPLVRSDVAVDVLKALLAWRDAEASLIELKYLRADGPFAAALAKALRTSRAPFATLARFSRPLLLRAPSADACLAQMSPRLRKELRRKHRRLSERPTRPGRSP